MIVLETQVLVNLSDDNTCSIMMMTVLLMMVMTIRITVIIIQAKMEIRKVGTVIMMMPL